MKVVHWAYGVTTVPQRAYSLLPTTLQSLANAGFPQPRLFVDGPRHSFVQFGLPLTARHEHMGAFGNWILALWELRIRHPRAHRYALFQDDILACKELREYLNRCKYPKGQGYWNLYSDPGNEIGEGWRVTERRGRGALGLVFDQDAVTALLGYREIVAKPRHSSNPDRCIDGAVVEAMNGCGMREYVHTPSLLQHTGKDTSAIAACSNLPHAVQEQSKTFPGEDFDATCLIKN